MSEPTRVRVVASGRPSRAPRGRTGAAYVLGGRLTGQGRGMAGREDRGGQANG